MSLLTDFDIATDLKVEFYIPNDADNLFIIGVSDIGGTNVLAGAGWFIIGVSEIGGTDVLAEGEYAFDWQDLNCDTSRVVTALGGQVENMTYFIATPSSAQIQLQSYTYDPTNNRQLDQALRSGQLNRVTRLCDL